MKKLLLVLLFSCIGLTASFAQAHQNFTLVNKTGVSIDQLFISAADVKDWQEDVLGVDILLTEEECAISFEPGDESCKWDLKIVDGDGDEVEWYGIDLCKAYIVTLYWQDGKAWAEIDETEPTDEDSGN